MDEPINPPTIEPNNDQILDDQTRQEMPQDINQPAPEHFGWLKQNYLLVLGGVLVLILIIVAGLWFFRNKREAVPTAPNVVLNIKGPETLAAGNETEYRIIYVNGENADLSNISLEVFYPANFKFSTSDPEPTSSNGQRYDLPVLRQGQTGEVKVRGKLNGATGELKEIRARLSYTMSNFSSEFSTEASAKTSLTAPALEMEITGPIDVTNGQNTTFTVHYKNVSGKEFDVAAVELKYPEGYKFASAVPAPTKDNNYWTIGKLPIAGEGKIEVTGSFIGDPGSEQQVSGDLGLFLASGIAPQIHASAQFKIQASTLSLSVKSDPDSTVELGQRITYTLGYANYGSVGQSNVVISATVEGASLDLPKITANNGIITGNTVTWKSATVSALGLLTPNQKGEVTFSVPLKPSVSTNIKNQVIKVTTTIYSDQVTNPVRGQESEIKLNSQLGMIISGRYVSGALPMHVGQSTTFEISMLLTNLSNDISDTELLASMPLPAGSWANIITPESEKSNITFDSNASKIRWKVGNLAAFVGKFTPARIATFQLQVTPSESDRGKEMTLLKDIQATATDTFTNLELTSTKINELKVGDLGDDRIDGNGASVE